MEDRVSARQYAKARGLNCATVLKWCAKGNLPGVIKVPLKGSGTGFQYWIPKNAEPIRPKQKYVKRSEWTEAEAPGEPAEKPPQKLPLPELVTMHDKAEHIRKFCVTRSYQRLRMETGLSHDEIRRIYDRLHERYGI